MKNYNPIYFGADTETNTTGADDITELERLARIEQDEKDAKAARATNVLKDLLSIGAGLFNKDDDDSSGSSDGGGSGSGGDTTINVPGTGISASALLIPAAVIGGIFLFSRKKK